jgi:sulfatase maturation enzyme AslB (radical SAM superfamily)
MALKNTFCAAPWFQARIDWDGRYRPCCGLVEKNSKFNGRTHYSLKDTTVDEWMSSEYSQYLREQLSNGVQLPECNNCWQKEKNSISSYRQQVNDAVTDNRGDNLDNTWVKLFIDRNQDYQKYLLVAADVKLSNVCNFSCAMCSPFNSSKVYDKWQSNLDNKFVQEKLQQEPTFLQDIATNYQTQRGYQHLKDILNHPLRYLKLLGGEPLLDKEMFRVLQEKSPEKKSKISIGIVTNGSQNLIHAAKKLEGYKSVNFTVSLEGVGDIQDYVRKGSNWAEIEKNILTARSHGILVNVHHTIQAMTALNLNELLLWCNDNQIPLSLGILDYPAYLDISVLPDNIRTLIIDNLNKIKDINIINSADNTELLSVNNIINLIDNLPILSDRYSKFLEYVAWFEENSSKKLQDIQPLFYTG